MVDDDLDVREAMADAVQSTGRHTLTARSGAEALALLADPSFPRPYLVLLNWTMSPMSGAEFLEHSTLELFQVPGPNADRVADPEVRELPRSQSA